MIPFAAALMLAVGHARAAELTVHEIVDRANKTLRGDSNHATLSMTIVTPNWSRNLNVEAWNLGRKLAYIYIHSPPKEKGNATLRRHNEMWLWLRRVERVIKIPPTMMHNSWQGSDFTYEDIIKADSVVRDYTHNILETTREAERTVYLIEALPKPDAPVVWGRVVMKVAVYPPRSDAGSEYDVVPLHEQDFSERGELIRTITLSDIRRFSGHLVPARLECVPAKKKGRKTTLQYHAIDFDVPLEDGFFSLARLQGSKS